MTSTPAILLQDHEHDPDASVEDRPAPPRVRLRPGPPTGHVDGAWWPRSRDLADELPALLGGIAGRVGTVAEVSYHPADWIDTTRDGTADEPHERTDPGDPDGGLPCTVHVCGTRASRTILILPPEMSEMVAADILAAVLVHGHHIGAQALLRSHDPSRGLGGAASVAPNVDWSVGGSVPRA